MKDEIKEILDRLKDSAINQIIDVPVMGGVSEPIDNSQCLEPKECKILLDYITNLQEELDRCVKANVILDDENAELQGKINNLQEENERLKIEKTRREKAVSILKNLKYIDKYSFAWDREFYKAINILNGGDE